MANPARAYLATQVETTTQGELLIMLYDAAIKFLKRAKIEIDNKDFAKKGIYISKAMAIIHELMESLNKEKGGEITPKLGQLYMFCTSHLIKANIRLDKKKIDEVIQILDGLRSAYAQIIPEVEGKTSSAKSVSAQPANAPVAAPVTQTQAQPASPTKTVSSDSTVPKAAPQMPPVPPVQPAPAAPIQQPEANEVQQQNQTATPEPAKPVVPPQPPTPPKLRTAFNAAKFRAANAYSNNNS